MTRWVHFVIILIAVGFLFFIDYDRVYTESEYNLLKDQVELISWIFASLMVIISFFGLFIGFLHENKLAAASKIIREIYRPYTISLENIRQNLINYESSLSRDNLIKFIYFSFLFVSVLTIIVWGTAVGLYTQYQYSFNIQLTVEALINLGIYVVFLTLASLLIAVTTILNQIRLHKDPLGEGYLPSPEKLCDIDYLSRQKMDFDELILKTAPIVEIYKNPPNNKPTYEVNLHFPIKWKNYKFILKLYDKDKNTVLKTYGILKQINFVGEQYTECLTESFKEVLYVLLGTDSNGELKIYNSEDIVVSRLFLQLERNNSNLSFVSNRIIKHRDTIDLDKGLFNNLKKKEIECDF